MRGRLSGASCFLGLLDGCSGAFDPTNQATHEDRRFDVRRRQIYQPQETAADRSKTNRLSAVVDRIARVALSIKVSVGLIRVLSRWAVVDRVWNLGFIAVVRCRGDEVLDAAAHARALLVACTPAQFAMAGRPASVGIDHAPRAAPTAATLAAPAGRVAAGAQVLYTPSTGGENLRTDITSTPETPKGASRRWTKLPASLSKTTVLPSPEMLLLNEKPSPC